MLISYGMSIAGTSHIKKNIPCQDSSRFEKLSNGWIAAVVADGVGSAKHSDIASAIACDVFIDTCKELVTSDCIISEAKNIISAAYKNAEEKIREYVSKEDGILSDYDTTLSAVLFDGDYFAFGHSGDGGIIILSQEGDYIKITKPQKGADGISVLPLRAGENTWEFGFSEIKTAAVLLATDGVYDSFNPYLLKGQPVELYIPVVRWFMDINIIGINSENRDAVEESRRRFLTGENSRAITDDKTVVVVFNTDTVPRLKDPSFYMEPDWAKLQDIWNRKAYPHLYKKETEISENGSCDSVSQTGAVSEKDTDTAVRETVAAAETVSSDSDGVAENGEETVSSFEKNSEERESESQECDDASEDKKIAKRRKIKLPKLKKRKN